jgi:K+-sensing histidine kinase KdpD
VVRDHGPVPGPIGPPAETAAEQCKHNVKLAKRLQAYNSAMHANEVADALPEATRIWKEHIEPVVLGKMRAQPADLSFRITVILNFEQRLTDSQKNALYTACERGAKEITTTPFGYLDISRASGGELQVSFLLSLS